MRIVAAALALLVYTLVASPSLAAPSVESDVTVDGTEIHQEINARGGEFHYFFSGKNPSGMPEFCVTLRLERKRDGVWNGIGRGPERRRHFCCDADDSKCRPDDEAGVWDLFVYPTDRLWRRVRNGKLRVRGFTDLGPSLALRWRP